MTAQTPTSAVEALRACSCCGCPDELTLDSDANAAASWVECGLCGYRMQLACPEESLVEAWNAADRAAMPVYAADDLPRDPSRQMSDEERTLRATCDYWYARAKELESRVAALAASQEAPKAGVWVLVPRELIDVAREAAVIGSDSSRERLLGLLAAAPTPPASQGDAAPAGDAVRALARCLKTNLDYVENYCRATELRTLSGDARVVLREAHAQAAHLVEALAAAPAPAAPAGDADRLVTSITLPQAQALVAYFGGDNTEVLIYDLPEGRITDDDGKPSPAGLYAVCAECPEEGATYLGDHNPDAPTHPREVVTEAMVADVLDCQPLTAENRGSRFYQLLTVPHDQAPAVMRFVLEVALAARSGARKTSQ